MIVAHYWKNIEPEEPRITFLAVVNDEIEFNDYDVASEAIANDDGFDPKEEVLYTLYLQRAIIESSYPLSEPSFEIVHFTEMEQNENAMWSEPVLQF